MFKRAVESKFCEIWKSSKTFWTIMGARNHNGTRIAMITKIVIIEADSVGYFIYFTSLLCTG